MSFQAMTWAIEQKVGNSTAKFLLLILANYADNAGVCWPSQQTLADDTEMSDRSIRTAIGYLVEKGLLSVTHRPGTGEGRKSNIYRLELPEKFSECRGGNRKNLQGQPENFVGQPEKSSDKPIIEPVKEPVTPPSPVGDGASAPNARQILFDEGLSLLVTRGTPEKHARSLIGQLLRDCDDDAIRVLNAIRKASGMADPVAWLQAGRTAIHSKRNNRNDTASKLRAALAEHRQVCIDGDFDVVEHGFLKVVDGRG